MAFVELRPAFEWICEECGRSQFASAVRPSLTGKEIAELKEEQGITPWDIGEFLAAPSEVTCEHCGTFFNTRDD